MDFHLSGFNKKPKQKHPKKEIDLLNVVYDEEFVSLINSLSTYIKNFYTVSLKIVKDLSNNSLIIDNNSIYSKCLINEINYNMKEKLKQLNERIESICNTKKILEKNILLIDSNLSKFYNDSKRIFKSMKALRNSKINYAIDTSVNYEGNNSMTNFKTSFEKEDLLVNKNDNNFYRNINSSICYENEKPLSCSRTYKLNKIFPISRKNNEIDRRYNLKLNYLNNGTHHNNNNEYNNIIINNNSLKLKYKLGKKKNNSVENIFSSTTRSTPSYKNINKNTLDSSSEFYKTKSSLNNFYINQNSNINLNNNNYNNNLELSYKV